MSRRRRVIDFDDSEDESMDHPPTTPKKVVEDDEYEFDGTTPENVDPHDEWDETVETKPTKRRQRRAAASAALHKLRDALSPGHHSDNSSETEDEEPVPCTPTNNINQSSVTNSTSARRSSSRVRTISAQKTQAKRDKFDALLSDQKDLSLREAKTNAKRQRVIKDEDDDEEYEEEESSDEYLSSDNEDEDNKQYDDNFLSTNRRKRRRRRRKKSSKPKEERETADDEDFYRDDIKNFIVDDDDEEEAQSSSDNNNNNDNSSSDSEDEEENEFEATSTPLKHKHKTKKHSNNNEDNNKEEEEEEEEIYVRQSGKKRRRNKKRIVKDDEDDDDALSGPALYRHVDALREEQEVDYSERRGATMTLDDAFEAYIELLARANIEPEFVGDLHRRRHHRDHAKYEAATRMVEGRLCTTRESVFASMAWKLDFEAMLSSHGFYRYNFCEGVVDVCDACGRSSHTVSVQVCLYGKEYKAKRVWEPGRWDEELPEGTLLYERSNNTRANGDWWKLKQGPTHWYNLGRHCFSRTFQYHMLLHYKFRLILKVADKLQRVGTVDALMKDRQFIEEEFDRYQSLLSRARLDKTEKRGRRREGGADGWSDDDGAAHNLRQWLARQDSSDQEANHNNDDDDNHNSEDSDDVNEDRRAPISRWLSTSSRTAEHPNRAPLAQDFATSVGSRGVVELSSDEEAEF